MNKISRFFKYLFLTIASLFSIFPLYWMFVSATRTSKEIINGTLIPGTAFFDNLSKLVADYPLLEAMKNSFMYASLATFLALLVCSLAGYGFEVYHDKYKDRVMTIILLSMMIPFAAIMIPLFTMISRAGLLNSAVGFVLPTMATPFLIMLFRQTAKSFPHEIVDAARIDGLKEIGIFFRMFIPVMRSNYAAAMTITFMSSWNSYLWPKIIMNDGESLTMPMLTANLKAGYVTDYGVLLTCVFISTLPTIIIFFLLQKSFSEGISGSVKG